MTNEQSKREIVLPQEIVESFARFIAPEIQKYYESEQGQKAFKEWEARHSRDTAAQQKRDGQDKS